MLSPMTIWFGLVVVWFGLVVVRDVLRGYLGDAMGTQLFTIYNATIYSRAVGLRLAPRTAG